MRAVVIFILFTYITHATCRPGRCVLRSNDEVKNSDDYSEGHENEAAANYDPLQQRSFEQADENAHEDTDNNLQAEPEQGGVEESPPNRAVDGLRQNLNTAESNIVNKRSDTNNLESRNEDGDLLFENYLRNQQKYNSKTAFNNQDENQDLSEQSRYFKNYYNKDRRKQPSESCDAAGKDFNRDRREASKAAVSSDDSASLKNKLENQEISSDEEEAAIKRHVKKLSSEELDQLLNSLSVDKRGLLEKIMESESASNGLNKREITKKDGAIEEHILIESGQLQSASPFVVSSHSHVSQSTEAFDTDKPSDNVSSKDFLPEINYLHTSENNADLASPSEEQLRSVSTVNDGQAQSVPSESCSSIKDADFATVTKSANKREAHNEDYRANSDKSYYSERESDSGYMAAQEEQDEDDDSEVEEDDSVEESETPHKREATYQKYSELTDSERSLEDSFPNSKAYEDSDPYAASDMLPLVRVKRKNTDAIPAVVRKRSAAVMPDAKVGFVPYKAENDDEDNDEANEFDDNGFYDRSSNFKVNYMGNGKDSPEQEAESSNDKSDNMNMRNDKTNLGSDTDGVLSGVEGVDENLMLRKQSSELVEQNSDTDELRGSREVNHIRARRSASEQQLSQQVTGKPVNAPIYHEIDSFGPLPHDRDTETSRFKRIRRVKHGTGEINP